tara:strand:+ start:1452 stop:2273 length:822 start_codon:yes stop_codon:yes gene_type:complete
MVKKKKDKVAAVFEPSTIETIDFASFSWLDNNLDIFVNSNKGFSKVPVLWVAPERSFRVKASKEFRDKEGTVIMPVITLERSGMSKDPTKRGAFPANIPSIGNTKENQIAIRTKIKKDKSSNFAKATNNLKKGQINFPSKNEKVVYETYYIPQPVYVNVSYTVTLRSEYQQQMNTMIQPFAFRNGHQNYYRISQDGHVYEMFIDPEFTDSSNVAELGDEERRYITEVKLNVRGYLLGEGENQEKPKVVVRENAVDFKITRERVILDESDIDLL